MCPPPVPSSPQNYRDKDMFLDEAITDTDLFDDLALPSPLACNYFAERVVTANLLWAHGNTSSYLHHDGSDNFLIVLSGSRDALVAAPNASAALYADDFIVASGLSPIDPDAINLTSHPRVAEVEWHHGELRAGDILYIPQYWWHQLEGSGAPGTAISLWFQSFNFDANLTVPDDLVVASTAEFEALVDTAPETIACRPGAFAFSQVIGHLGNSTEYASNMDQRPQLPPSTTIPISRTIPGTVVPAVMLGTARLEGRAEEVIKTALDVGYRAFDSGAITGYSETSLGQVLAESAVPRTELFITTKLNPRFHGYDSTLASFRESLAALQTE
jgi:mannose-6-phosphate isomerase-like protein (cupin superfamily)